MSQMSANRRMFRHPLSHAARMPTPRRNALGPNAAMIGSTSCRGSHHPPSSSIPVVPPVQNPSISAFGTRILSRCLNSDPSSAVQSSATFFLSPYSEIATILQTCIVNLSSLSTIFQSVQFGIPPPFCPFFSPLVS